MTTSEVNLPYVDSAIEHMEDGGPSAFWHHLHWGLYDDPSVEDDRDLVHRYFELINARDMSAPTQPGRTLP